MKNHTLKIKKEYHVEILSGDKKCEIRKNDRDFQKGDTIFFGGENVYDESLYEITHVLHFPTGLKEDYVALSISKINDEPT